MNEEITAEMLYEAFCQTQREILDLQASDHIKNERYQFRWERMAQLLNEKRKQQNQELTP